MEHLAEAEFTNISSGPEADLATLPNERLGKTNIKDQACTAILRRLRRMRLTMAMMVASVNAMIAAPMT